MGLLGSPLRLAAKVSIQELFCHIGKKEEGLDKRIEVARVANVLESNGNFVKAHPFVKGQRLSLKTGLDSCCDLCILLLHALAYIPTRPGLGLSALGLLLGRPLS